MADTQDLSDILPIGVRPQIKVWVENGDRFVFGDQEVRLLEAIAARGTLSDVASTLGLSYRSIWGKIREVEARLGTKLVQSTVGGSGGGSTQLTPAAERLVLLYSRFRSALGDYAMQEFEPCSSWLSEGCCDENEPEDVAPLATTGASA